MPKARKTITDPALGPETQLWQKAGAVRKTMDRTRYQYLVLGPADEMVAP